MVQRALCMHSHEIVPYSITLQQHCCKQNMLFASLPSPSCSPLLCQSRCRQTVLQYCQHHQEESGFHGALKTLPVLKLQPLCAGSAHQQLNRARLLSAWMLCGALAWKGLPFWFFLGMIVFLKLNSIYRISYCRCQYSRFSEISDI